MMIGSMHLIKVDKPHSQNSRTAYCKLSLILLIPNVRVVLIDISY